MNKNAAKANATKQKLCDAFMELYEKKDINRISIRDITDLAGYNRGTFYLYFLDIYDMFDQIKTEMLDQLTELYQSVEINNKTFSIEAVTEIILKFLQKNEKYFIAFALNDATLISSIIKTARPVLYKTFGITSANDDQKDELDFILEYHYSAVIYTINFWVKKGKPCPIEKLSDIIFEIASRGAITLLREKGL